MYCEKQFYMNLNSRDDGLKKFDLSSLFSFQNEEVRAYGKNKIQCNYDF